MNFTQTHIYNIGIYTFENILLLVYIIWIYIISLMTGFVVQGHNVLKNKQIF